MKPAQDGGHFPRPFPDTEPKDRTASPGKIARKEERRRVTASGVCAPSKMIGGLSPRTSMRPGRVVCEKAVPETLVGDLGFGAPQREIGKSGVLRLEFAQHGKPETRTSVRPRSGGGK